MKKLAAIAAFAALALSACATGAFLPDSFNHILNTSVMLSNDSGHGTGTVIAGNLVLTAGHVVEMGDLTVTMHDGTTRHAHIIWKDAQLDVGVMKFDGAPVAEAAVIDCKPMVYGELIQWIGNPSILLENYGRGFVSDPKPILNKNGTNTGMIAIAAPVNPGDSGSGVFNLDGNLRGVAVALLVTHLGMTPSQSGTGLMIPASMFCTQMQAGILTEVSRGHTL